MITNIRVSGNILSELSEKIPTIIIALNELMKNSYDAGASYVCINIVEETHQLIVSDDGAGMDTDDISTLFHISESTKSYGKINEYGRITQGSKGLGFLSVFKFGPKVTWRTNKQAGLQFSVDFNDILTYEDISNYEVEITENNDIPKGTEIIIDMSDYSMQALILYLSDEKNNQKILHSFNDNGFTVKLNFGGNMHENTGKKEIGSILPTRQLYRVKYHSEKGKLEFYINNSLAISKDFNRTDHRYTVDLDIIIFQLIQHDKKKIAPLFFNPQEELTPLIYVNSNLFNNYSIFDPNIMRHTKSSLVLGQMIGYISLISDNTLLNFNSDRTQFLQNELTDNVLTFLESINKRIQEIGSFYKNHVIDFDILKKNSLPYSYIKATEAELRSNIVDTFKFKDKVSITKNKNYITYSLFNREASAIIQEKAAAIPAVIKVKEDDNRIPIISNQISLDGYILSVTDSNGASVDKRDVNIFVDDSLSKNRVLGSISEECKITLRFEYNDAETGKVVESIELEFYQPAAEVTAATTKNKLLTIDAKENYQIVFNYSIQRLILQLNNLDISSNLEIIACSLRALFEISTYCVGQQTHYSSLYSGQNALAEKVKKTVEYISSDKSKKQQIANNSGISFHSLDNSLIPNDYYNVIKKAHLGAHKSTVSITEPEIRDLAHKASLFVVIANEMINNHI